MTTAVQNAVSARLARHVFVTVLFQCAKSVAAFLAQLHSSLTAIPSEYTWLDALQFRHDFAAIVQVFSGVCTQARWPLIKSSFAECVRVSIRLRDFLCAPALPNFGQVAASSPQHVFRVA